MALIEVNFSPTHRQLRQFGTICLWALPLITWIWTRSSTAVGYAAAAGAVLFVLSRLAPNALRPVYLTLILISLPIGLIVGEIVLLLIFFGLFVPMAVLFRLIGRDALQRRKPPETDTFWHHRDNSRNLRSYFRQW
ncbi:MAG: hypothetical protein KDA89_12765 [Planctomycetaceae bacterium]|nr:hypothetical protein [Planctomycetaceae bacterium]